MQSGDPETIRLWTLLVGQSLNYFDGISGASRYQVTRDDVVGESYYNPLLPAVVDDLAKLGSLLESEGALCVFPPGHTNR